MVHKACREELVLQMGNCKKVLYEGELENRTITPSSMWGDLCETIHVHIRNTRYDFSKREFDNLYNALTILKEGVAKGIAEYGWEPGHHDLLISYDNGVRLDKSSDYYANRLKIELEKQDDVHLHMREFRLHLRKSEFKQFAKAIAESLKVLEEEDAKCNDISNGQSA